jgi:hypothetical protein
MDHFAGLDVSVKETSVCILDDAGKIVKEVKVASEPEALLKLLGNPTPRLRGPRCGIVASRQGEDSAGYCRAKGAWSSQPASVGVPLANGRRA